MHIHHLIQLIQLSSIFGCFVYNRRMSKKVDILRQPKSTHKIPIDVKALLASNRKVIEDFKYQIQKLQGEACCRSSKHEIKKVIQRRKEKNQQLKPKAAYFQEETVNMALKKNFNTLTAERLSSNHQYWENSTIPAACVGFSMAYNQVFNKAYVYGGISCNNTLENGLKNYFYEFDLYTKKWREVQPKSIYLPTTRYGHTLTAYNKELILFGGVSEYKAKLKDRCQYPQINIYEIGRNQWKMMETFSSQIRPRKNHASCIYQSYYVVFGGQNTNQDILNQIIVINLESKKPRWRIYPTPGRVNHQIIHVPNLSGGNKQFLYSFGGLKHRPNSLQQQVCNDIILFPISFEDNHLVLKDPTICTTNFTPRQTCIFCRFDEGILIIGGLNEKKEVVKECQYLSVQNLTLKTIKIEVNWDQMRQPQGVTITPEQVLVFGGNSHAYMIQK